MVHRRPLALCGFNGQRVHSVPNPTTINNWLKILGKVWQQPINVLGYSSLYLALIIHMFNYFDTSIFEAECRVLQGMPRRLWAHTRATATLLPKFCFRQ